MKFSDGLDDPANDPPEVRAAVRAMIRDLDLDHDQGDAAEPAAGLATEAKASIVSRSLSEITIQAVNWIWPGWVPAGMLSILDGDPADGKSTITIDIAARLTRGRAMPGCEAPARERGNVLFLAAEDSAEHTIAPRCEAACADPDRVRVSECIRIGDRERPIRLPDDIQALEREIVDHKIALLIIDPFLGFLSQAVDSHKDASIRDVLHELKLLAGRTGAAVLALRHLSKGSGGGNPLYRGMGSIAITASARSAFTVAAHPTEPGTRVIASTKLNIGRPPRSLSYTIQDCAGYPVIAWGEPCDLTAADLGAVTPQRDGGKLDLAKDVIRTALANGPRPESEIQKLASDHDISSATLRRAKAALGVSSNKGQFSGRWMWELPSVNEDAQGHGDAEGAQPT